MINVEQFSWVWPNIHQIRKANLQKFVVKVDGVFLKRVPDDGKERKLTDDDIIWFSRDFGTFVGCSPLYFKKREWQVEEKETHWVPINKERTSWNQIPKDDFNYFEFESRKECVITARIKNLVPYIVEVSLDKNKMLEGFVQ